MVTHEPDIAAYTKRNIVMRDGRVRSDILVQNRTFAAEEMKKIEAAARQDEEHPHPTPATTGAA